MPPNHSSKLCKFRKATVAHNIFGPLIYEFVCPSNTFICPEVIEILFEQVGLNRAKIHAE